MELTLIIIGAVLLALFLLPLFSKVFNFGNLAGCALGIGFIMAGYGYEKMSFFIKKWSFFILFVSLALVLMVTRVIIIQGRKHSATDEQLLIVLGCKVKGDEPSLALVKRVNSAYNYMLCHPESVAILSGGQGRDEKLSEALCMYKMLTDRGVSPSRLIMEDKSRSTDENIRFSADIIKEKSLPKELIIVSSEYHLYRAGLICSRYGLHDYSFIASRTRPDLLPTFLLREAMALVKENLRR